MYTEFHFNSRLKRDTPQGVIDTLKWMLECGGGDPPFATPSHVFFSAERWSRLFCTDSYSFDADTHCTLRYDEIARAYFLCVRTNLKNYDSEIEKFVHWISPHLEKVEGDFLGFLRFEAEETPTIIYHTGK